MAVTIASGATESVAANTKSSDLVDGQYQYIGKGKIIFTALPSGAGLNVTLKVGGVSLIDDKPISWFGTSGNMDRSAHTLIAQAVAGGRVELFLRNTTSLTITCDYVLDYEP